MNLTALELYNQLVNVDQITCAKGLIRFELGDVKIIVKQKDVVGNLMQEWLQGWLDKNEVSYSLNSNSQMPPDFFLDPKDPTSSLLEVKAFDRKASPGFDIADFTAYANELLKHPYMLEVDYLIFGYDMASNGDVTIKDVWLKKVWEITRRMQKWPLNLQIKQNTVHKIRPGVWYSNKKGNFPMFKSKEHFLSAFEQTIWQNSKTRELSNTWKNSFLESWKKHYGKSINFPRWSEIESKYIKTNS